MPGSSEASSRTCAEQAAKRRTRTASKAPHGLGMSGPMSYRDGCARLRARPWRVCVLVAPPPPRRELTGEDDHGEREDHPREAAAERSGREPVRDPGAGDAAQHGDRRDDTREPPVELERSEAADQPRQRLDGDDER